MSPLGVVLTVLVVLVLLTALANVGCWIAESVRVEQRRRDVRTQTLLAEMELQRVTRQAMSQMLDEARQAQTSPESWREP